MSWPVLLVIGAIGLLAAGCYLLIKHWDDVQAAVMNTAVPLWLALSGNGLPVWYRRHGNGLGRLGNDSNLLLVFYVQIMPDDFVMQLHRF